MKFDPDQHYGLDVIYKQRAIFLYFKARFTIKKVVECVDLSK